MTQNTTIDNNSKYSNSKVVSIIGRNIEQWYFVTPSPQHNQTIQTKIV